MKEEIKYVCVPVNQSTINALKEAVGTDVTKAAVYDAIEFRIKAGKLKKEMD